MKYQLVVYWKDGNASGRVIDVDWPFTHKLTEIKRVKLGRAPKVYRGKAKKATDARSEKPSE